MASGWTNLLALTVALGAVTAGRAGAEGTAPPAADPVRGARIGYTCLGCHGIADYRNAYPSYHVPKLGGQHAGYLVAALGEYRAGARPHPTMQGQAASLTEQDIRDVAAYFATSEPVKSAAGPAPAAPAAAQTCVACHGPDGIGILPEYPTLAGQHPDYLEQALRAYRKGARQNAVMNGMAATLKEEDIPVVAAYFAAQAQSLRVPTLPRAPAAK